jgi:hypothetical protein
MSWPSCLVARGSRSWQSAVSRQGSDEPELCLPCSSVAPASAEPRPTNMADGSHFGSIRPNCGFAMKSSHRPIPSDLEWSTTNLQLAVSLAAGSLRAKSAFAKGSP